jgi:hypothetical protein
MGGRHAPMARTPMEFPMISLTIFNVVRSASPPIRPARPANDKDVPASRKSA